VVPLPVRERDHHHLGRPKYRGSARTTRWDIADATGLDSDMVDAVVASASHRFGVVAVPAHVLPDRRLCGMRVNHGVGVLHGWSRSSRYARAGPSDGPYQVSIRPLTRTAGVRWKASGPSSAVKT